MKMQKYIAMAVAVIGAFALEARTFDEYVQFCLDCGLGPDISCYSLCPWTLGKTIDENELERRWGSFLNRFAAHLREKGWYGQTLMAMDEAVAGKSNFTKIRQETLAVVNR